MIALKLSGILVLLGLSLEIVQGKPMGDMKTMTASQQGEFALVS